MIAGAMDKHIKLEIETTTVNDVGTPIETYALLRWTYASKKDTTSGTDFDEAGHPFTNTEFSVRWNSDITGSNRYKIRVQYDSQYYKVLHSQDIGRKDGIRLKCILWDE